MQGYNSDVGLPVGKAKEVIHQYGLGLLFAANIFGAGSVYILTEAGVNFGFGLLWVLPLALGVVSSCTRCRPVSRPWTNR